MKFPPLLIRMIGWPLLIAAIGWLVADRYFYLKTKHEIHLFFQRANACLNAGIAGSMMNDEDQNSRLQAIYDGIVAIQRTEPSRFRDPFGTVPDASIQFGIGTVIHQKADIKRQSYHHDTVVFVSSRGPSRKDISIEATMPYSMHDGLSGKIMFLDAPYDISNGLFSRGYLYADTNGVRLGDTPLVGE